MISKKKIQSNRSRDVKRLLLHNVRMEKQVNPQMINMSFVFFFVLGNYEEISIKHARGRDGRGWGLETIIISMDQSNPESNLLNS